MIDVHTHILYDIDDGAKDITESLRLIDMEISNDVDTVVLTPHFDSYRDLMDIFVQKCQERYDVLLQHIQGKNITLRLGSETYYSSALTYYSTLAPLCITGTKYLLVEFSPDMRFDKEFFAELQRLVYKFDVVPIIAHVERYRHIQKHIKIIDKFKELGCIIQTNAGYILHNINNKFVRKLFKYGYVDMVASDCHDRESRSPNLKEAVILIDERYHGYYTRELAGKYNEIREKK